MRLVEAVTIFQEGYSTAKWFTMKQWFEARSMYSSNPKDVHSILNNTKAKAKEETITPDMREA